MHRAPEAGGSQRLGRVGMGREIHAQAFETSSEYMTVVVPPTIVEAFGTNAIPLNGQTTLSITIANPNAAIALTGISLADGCRTAWWSPRPTICRAVAAAARSSPRRAATPSRSRTRPWPRGDRPTFGVNVSGRPPRLHRHHGQRDLLERRRRELSGDRRHGEARDDERDRG